MKKNTTQCKWQFFTILQKLPCYYYVQFYSCKQMLYLMIRLITTLIRIMERTYLTFIKKCLWMLYLLWYKALEYPYIYSMYYRIISSNCIYYNFYLERAYCALDNFSQNIKVYQKTIDASGTKNRTWYSMFAQNRLYNFLWIAINRTCSQRIARFNEVDGCHYVIQTGIKRLELIFRLSCVMVSEIIKEHLDIHTPRQR